MVKNNFVVNSKTSAHRRLISYILLGIATVIPLSFYYIPIFKNLFTEQILLIEFPFFDQQISIFFDTALTPAVLSVMIGVTFGFILRCYYTRTRCSEEQVPSSVLLCNDDSCRL